MKSYTFTEEELKKRLDATLATCLLVSLMAQMAGEEKGRSIMDDLPKRIHEIFTKD